MPDVGWVLLLVVLGLIGSAILLALRPDLRYAALAAADSVDTASARCRSFLLS